MDLYDYHSYDFQYNTRTNTWSTFCKLKIRRQNFASDIIEGKLVITGGIDYPFPFLGLKHPSYDITEVIDLSMKTTHIAGNLITPRQNHGMSVMKIGSTFKLITFGGESTEGDGLLDSIEVWNSQTETWELPHLENFKLKDKVSRFSTLTVFNGLKSTNPINLSISKDEPEQPKIFKEWVSCFAFISLLNMLIMICAIFRIIPETLMMTLKIVAWYEMIIQSSYLSLSTLKGTNDFQHNITSFIEQFLNMFSHSGIILPEKFGKFIQQFLNKLSQIDEMPVAIPSLAFYMLSRPFSQIALNVYPDTMYDETLQVMLSLGFVKIPSTLSNLNRFSKKNSFLQLLTGIISDPVFSLLYVALLMNSEACLRIVSFMILIIFVAYHIYAIPKIETFLYSIGFLAFIPSVLIVFDSMVSDLSKQDSVDDPTTKICLPLNFKAIFLKSSTF